MKWSQIRAIKFEDEAFTIPIVVENLVDPVLKTSADHSLLIIDLYSPPTITSKSTKISNKDPSNGKFSSATTIIVEVHKDLVEPMKKRLLFFGSTKNNNFMQEEVFRKTKYNYKSKRNSQIRFSKTTTRNR